MAAQTEVQLVVQVVDKATGELRNIGNSFKGLEGATGQVIGLNQALGLVEKGLHLLEFAVTAPINQFKALADVSTDLVRKYDDAFLAQTRLRTVLRATGQGGEEQAKQLEALAQSLAKVTRFEDDAIVAGQALAVGAGVQAKDLQRFSEAALDLATFLGVDAVDGFRSLNQAIQTGTIRGFKSSISDAKDEAVRFNQVLDFVSRNLGGQARAAALGGAGAIDQLSNAFGDLEEDLGKVIADTPQFKAFIQTAREGIEALRDFIAANQIEVGNTFGAVFAASFQIAIEAAKVFINVLEGVGSAIVGITNLLSKIPGTGVDSPFAKIDDTIKEVEERLFRMQATGVDPADVFFGPSGLKDLEAETKQVVDGLLKERERLLADPLGVQGVKASIQTGLAGIEDLAGKLPKLLTPEGFVEKWKENAQALREAGGATEKLAEQSAVFTSNFGEFNKLLKDIRAQSQDLISIDFIKEFQAALQAGQIGVEKFVEELDLLRRHGELTQDQFDQLAASARNAFSAQATVPTGATSAPATTPGSSGRSVGPPSSGAPAASGGGGDSGIVAALKGAAEELRAAGAAQEKAAQEVASAAAGTEIAAQALAVVAGAMGQGLAAVADAAENLDAAAESAAGGLQSAMDTAAFRLTQAARRLYQAGDKLAGGQGLAPFQQGGVIQAPILPAVLHGPEAVIPLNERGAQFARQAFGIGEDGGGRGGTINVQIDVDRLELTDRAVDDMLAEFSRKLADRVLETARRR